MCKQCFAGRLGGGAVQVKKFGYHPAVPAAVYNKPGGYFSFVTIVVFYRCYRVSTLKYNTGNGGFITDRHTHFFNGICQCFIELCPWSLPGPVPASCKLISKKIIADLAVLYKL